MTTQTQAPEFVVVERTIDPQQAIIDAAYERANRICDKLHEDGEYGDWVAEYWVSIITKRLETHGISCDAGLPSPSWAR